MAGGGFQEGFVQDLTLAVLISQESFWNRTMAGGAGFPSITRKGAGNLGYCHLSQVGIVAAIQVCHGHKTAGIFAVKYGDISKPLVT